MEVRHLPPSAPSNSDRGIQSWNCNAKRGRNLLNLLKDSSYCSIERHLRRALKCSSSKTLHHPFDGHTSCLLLDYFTVNFKRFSSTTFNVINSKNSVLKYGLQPCTKTCHGLSYNVKNISNNKRSKDLEALDKEAT